MADFKLNSRYNKSTNRSGVEWVWDSQEEKWVEASTVKLEVSKPKPVIKPAPKVTEK